MKHECPAPALLIDGEWISGGARKTMVVENPASGKTLSELPLSTADDLNAALGAAQRSFTTWRTTSPNERPQILKRAAALVRERAEYIARIVTLEVGKPLAESRWEVAVAADCLDWFAEEGRRAYGRVLPGRTGTARFTVVKEPVGPVASFAPWNFPVDNAAKKIASALAAGCTCIHKPAEEAPASAIEIARALVDAGLPRGVLSIVFGDPAMVSAHLIASPVIRKISFTGSIPIGKHLMRLAADGAKRTTMELGGHAPVIVCEDADIETVTTLATISKYRNAGQVCVSPTRFLVHRSRFDSFVESLGKKARALRVGDGLLADTQMGPLAHRRRLDATESLVQDAIDCGAELVAGGERLSDAGHFYSPTVLANVPLSARAMNEEPFGPVALVNAFDNVDDALVEANRLPVGLAAYAFTQHAPTLTRLSESIEAGMVSINAFMVATSGTPFGGVKESGHGAENGIEGLEACLVTKVISQS